MTGGRISYELALLLGLHIKFLGVIRFFLYLRIDATNGHASAPAAGPNTFLGHSLSLLPRITKS